MKYIKKHIWIGFLFTVLFVSCGYHFEKGGYINSVVTDVAVFVLDNKSSESGAGILFTNALIQEVLERTDTKVVDKSKATAFIKGSVNSIIFSTLSRSTTESVTERRVSAVIDLKLINKDGELIWSVKNFSSHENYTVSEGEITDEVNKRAAIDKIAQRTAEKLINTLQTDF